MSPVRISDETGQSDELQPLHQPRLWVQLYGRRRSEERRARPPEFRPLISGTPPGPPWQGGSGGVRSGIRSPPERPTPRLPGIAGQEAEGRRQKAGNRRQESMNSPSLEQRMLAPDKSIPTLPTAFCLLTSSCLLL